MDIYKELNLKPVLSEPNVWVSRLVIFEKLSPDPVIIRDIALARGLNIVWAEEPEDNDSSAEISGHSAGKTTFCRFLRYVLGERTFGTKMNMESIRKVFPEGYIAAEIHVAGRKWAIRRPFGSGRMSYIKEYATVEELLKQHSGSVSQDDYIKKLGFEGLLDKMESAAVVRTGETIEWGHILAWCARDQEARFQNIHEWRSPRSESDAPTFRFPKGGPLFVMRAALGLFLPDELKGEERLAELHRKKERLEKEIEEKRREPDFWVSHYDNELRRRLTSLLPNEKGIITLPLHSGNLLPDLHRLTDQAVSITEQKIQECERERSDIQGQIDDMGAQIGQLRKEHEQLDVLSELNTSAGKELDNGLLNREELRKAIENFKNTKCIQGAVLFSNCIHIQEQQKVLQITKLQDSRAMKQEEAKRGEERSRIEKDKSDLLATIERLRLQRDTLQTKRDNLVAKFRDHQQALHELKQAREALETWLHRRDYGDGYQELVVLRQKFDSANSEIEKLEKELMNLLRQHDVNRERLRSIFSEAVRSVLPSGSYDGKVSLDSRELAFRITHGAAMSGEAVETLSVLLSDIASLIHNTVYDKACLPGFLLHDSPREADLGIRIYKSFFHFVASLQRHFDTSDNCPFQYIITTTTPPPDELQNERFVKLRLNAAKPSELLLGRNIAIMVPNDTDLNLFKE
ncbi:MAG: hypothetical protein A3J24_01490 [Deltaproteobacteria bacterium RIFCSPLOWO2_02_FULL_53_8]|nr:MAG: hypothetical protein A3J24_01490 [Deltaproteobacteria bacterium RIFCSPLOWO2_02_FULL_53_8]